MKKIIAIICLLLSGTAQANSIADWLSANGVYFGGGIGYGSSVATNEPARHNITIYRQDSSETAGLFAGVRRGMWAVEVGALRLPTYRGWADTQDYPAYRGLPAGTYPQTAHVNADIFSKALYVRMNFHAPFRFAGLEPYAHFGRASLENYNHEYGNYNGTDAVDNAEVFVNHAWPMGVGVQFNVSGNWSGRLEYTRIPHAIVNEHTLDRTVSMAMLNMLYSF